MTKSLFYLFKTSGHILKEVKEKMKINEKRSVVLATF